MFLEEFFLVFFWRLNNSRKSLVDIEFCDECIIVERILMKFLFLVLYLF